MADVVAGQQRGAVLGTETVSRRIRQVIRPFRVRVNEEDRHADVEPSGRLGRQVSAIRSRGLVSGLYTGVWFSSDRAYIFRVGNTTTQSARHSAKMVMSPGLVIRARAKRNLAAFEAARRGIGPGIPAVRPTPRQCSRPLRRLSARRKP
ncbi:MAG: hypothetical protein U0736_18555 [Gemmataceae bacterium]